MSEREILKQFARDLQLLCEKLANSLSPDTNEALPDSRMEKALGHTPPTQIESFDPDKILWTPKQGDKGPYELATAKNNSGKLEYTKMIALLKTAGGSLSKEGVWYWLFTDGDACGRKETRKQTVKQNE